MRVYFLFLFSLIFLSLNAKKLITIEFNNGTTLDVYSLLLQCSKTFNELLENDQLNYVLEDFEFTEGKPYGNKLKFSIPSITKEHFEKFVEYLSYLFHLVTNYHEVDETHDKEKLFLDALVTLEQNGQYGFQVRYKHCKFDNRKYSVIVNREFIISEIRQFITEKQLLIEDFIQVLYLADHLNIPLIIDALIEFFIKNVAWHSPLIIQQNKILMHLLSNISINNKTISIAIIKLFPTLFTKFDYENSSLKGVLGIIDKAEKKRILKETILSNSKKIAYTTAVLGISAGSFATCQTLTQKFKNISMPQKAESFIQKYPHATKALRNLGIIISTIATLWYIRVLIARPK